VYLEAEPNRVKAECYRLELRDGRTGMEILFAMDDYVVAQNSERLEKLKHDEQV
jgi:hypothetical protein